MTPAARPSRGVATIGVAMAAMIAFLIAAPYTLLDLPHFLNGFARLASEYRAPANTSNPGWMVYLKQLRNALQWPGSLIVLAGLALSVVRVARGPDRLKWALPLVFSIAYFYFVSHQNIFFSRYLLPMVPSLSLLGAAAIIWIIDTMRSLEVPALVRQVITAVLTLLVIVPPAYAAIQFNAMESRVWTTEQAYRWILHTLPAGTTVAIEGSVTFQLPPEYPSTHVVQLRRKNVSAYRAGGVQYLVASSQEYGPILADPKHFPVEYDAYQRLFGETKEVVRFTPSPDHPGPELRVLRIE
jgi:hypothetical protein